MAVLNRRLLLAEDAELALPPTTEKLTRVSCCACNSERYVALLGRWSSCSVCGSTGEFIPTALVDELGLRLGRVRPFTHHPPLDAA